MAKARTAKQKAATKKLIAFNKSRARTNKKRAGSKKSKSKSKMKKTTTIKKFRKDFEMCSMIDKALKNKNVKKIIINK